MDINPFVFSGIIMRILGVLMLLALVIPVQFSELRRPRNEFTRLRWLLFAFVALYSVLNAFPLFYSFTSRLYSDPTVNLQNVTTLVANIANLTLTMLVVFIYRYKAK